MGSTRFKALHKNRAARTLVSMSIDTGAKDLGTVKVNAGSLGLWTATALVTGNMIGSGIFLLPASLAGYGGISLYGWGFSTAGALMVALVFAGLSRQVRGSGGPYAYTRAAFGDLPAFLVGWGYWVSMVAGNAAIAIALVGLLFIAVPIAIIRWVLRIDEIVLLLKHIDALLRSIDEKLGKNRP